jgi:hypothetical protein
MRLGLRSLIVFSPVLFLASSAAQDGLPPREAITRPLVGVLVQELATPVAEPIPAPAIEPQLAGTHDEALIARVLARPQPADPPSRQLERGNQQVHGPGMIRLWGQSVSLWEAPAYCHRPLYFEDEDLERHGRSFGLLQPAASVAHFTGRGLAWPYLAGAFPHHECVYPLGRGQPGTYATYHWYRPPVSARGALYEAAAATGLSYIVP